MNILKKAPRAVVVACLLGILIIQSVYAAASGTFPPADDFAILASTYTNTLPGTTINGDVGYTTAPAFPPTITGTTHVNDGIYVQAGADQADLLTDLNGEACDFTYGIATDFAALPQPLVPGVYCVNAAASIGTSGLTLDGNATYIFRINGAFTTSANSEVTLQGGASACDVFWTPSAATTLGANSSFFGTIIDDTGITIGANVDMTGRALAFAGTISSDADTISTPNCSVAPPSPATLHIIKVVNNANGGTAVPADFMIHVTDGGTDVSGSPAAGDNAPGTSYTLVAGTYEVSEDANSLYTRTFSDDCDAGGGITLAPSDDMTCTITNTDIAVIPPTPTSTPTSTPAADNGEPGNDNGGRGRSGSSVHKRNISSSDDSDNATHITTISTGAPVVNVSPRIIPGFPNTGYPH